MITEIEIEDVGFVRPLNAYQVSRARRVQGLTMQSPGQHLPAASPSGNSRAYRSRISARYFTRKFS